MMISIVKNNPIMKGFRIAEQTTIGRYDTII